MATEEKVKLTELGKRLLDSLEGRLQEYHDGATEEEDVPKEWEQYPLCWWMYCTDREGCVREVGDDLLGDICVLFYGYFAAIRSVVENELGISETSKGYYDKFMEIYVHPSYEGRTTAIVMCKSRVLLKDSCKAWGFGGESLEDLATCLEDDYKRILKGYKKVLRGR